MDRHVGPGTDAGMHSSQAGSEGRGGQGGRRPSQASLSNNKTYNSDIKAASSLEVRHAMARCC